MLFYGNRQLTIIFGGQHRGDEEKLTDKFTSILRHISNEHEWEDNGEKKRCEHEKLNVNEIRNKLWIDPESKSYYALKKIIMAKDF